MLELAGASLARDAVDARIVNDVETGTHSTEGSSGSSKGIIDSQNDSGGWPELASTPAPPDSSGDGMPDTWKTARKLDPARHEANGRDLSTAYDNVEVYLNSLVKEIVEKQ